MEGCAVRLRHHGLRTFATVAGDYTYNGGRSAFEHIVRKLGRNPDAVIAAADVMALGCMDTIRFDHGLQVPKDVSIVSFDGVEPANWASYSLATVRQPVREMAAAAVNLLLECVANPSKPPEKRVFSGVLVPGKSARLAESRGG
jgi:DNA-binding LacI/PurR family transcriptional regulator